VLDEQPPFNSKTSAHAPCSIQVMDAAVLAAVNRAWVLVF